LGLRGEEGCDGEPAARTLAEREGEGAGSLINYNYVSETHYKLFS
jgi:hypothetical protein